MKYLAIIFLSVICLLPLYAKPSKGLDKKQVKAISTELISKDIKKGQATVRKIIAMLNKDASVVKHVQKTWLRDLKKAKRYELVVELASKSREYVVNNVSALDGMQLSYVEALIDLKQWDKAIVEAKRYYMICRLENTPKAIDLLTVALQKEDSPEGRNQARRFRWDQLALDGQGTEQSAVYPNLSIKVPEGLKLPRLASGETYQSANQKGNLFLYVGKASDALKAYTQALKLADETEKSQVALNMARAIRAVDGHVHRANAWLQSGK